MIFFSTAVASQAQQVVITFPEYGASNIAIDAKITIQVNEPFIFDTTSLPTRWAKDTLESVRGHIRFLDQKYYDGSDSSIIGSMFVGGRAIVDSIDTDFQSIIIENIKYFDYHTTYGFLISGIKLINTQTQQVFEIDTLILGSFTTTHRALQFTSSSVQHNRPTCNENSFNVYFNDSLSSCQTELGPIVSVDTISIVKADSLTDSLIVSLHPINSSLQLINGNKDLRVTLDDNFNDSLLYSVNIHLSRLTGNENDDISFSFKSSSYSDVRIHSSVFNIKPYYDSSYSVKPGQKLTLAVPAGNEDYVFDRWVCAENPMILQGLADTIPEIEIEFTCENIRPELNFIPLYTKIPYDTLQMVYPRSSTGAILCTFQATNPIDSLNDSTFVFKQGTEFSVCNPCGEAIEISHWIVNGDSTVVASNCITQQTLDYFNLKGGSSIWEPVVREDPPPPCSTLTITVKIQGTSDLSMIEPLWQLVPHMQLRYKGNNYGISFGPDPGDPGNNKKAMGTVFLPETTDSRNLYLLFQEPESTLPQQYEFLSCNYPKGSQSYGNTDIKESLSHLLDEAGYEYQEVYFELIRMNEGSGCEHSFVITVRPRRVYLEVNEKMKYYGEYLPNESIAKVIVSPCEELKKKDHDNYLQSSEVLSRVKIYEYIFGQSVILYPKIEPNKGYDFYQWAPSEGGNTFESTPVSNTPYPNTLGPILMNGDKRVLLVLESAFILESITIRNDQGEDVEIDVLNDNGIFDREYTKKVNLALRTPVFANGDHHSLLHPNEQSTPLSSCEISLNFNRSLAVDPAHPDCLANESKDGIIFMDGSFVGLGRLDGLPIQTYKALEWEQSPYNYTISNNGQIENGRITYTIVNGSYNVPTHMSDLKITIIPEKLQSADEEFLTNHLNNALPTNYPAFTVIMDHLYTKKVDDEERWVSWSYGEQDEVYGFMWLAYKDLITGDIINPNPPSGQSGDRIPSFGTYDVNTGHDEYVNQHFSFVSGLSPESVVGFSSVFFDEDCGAWSSTPKFGEIMNKAAEILASKDPGVSYTKLSELVNVLMEAIGKVNTDNDCDPESDDPLFNDGYIWYKNGDIHNPNESGAIFFGNFESGVPKMYQYIGKTFESKYMRVYIKYKSFYF